MKTVRETPALTALLERYRTLTEPEILTQEEAEEMLHTEVWRGDWPEVLRLLDQMPGPISHKAARECLSRAVHSAPPEIFSALLDRLPDGEYTESESYSIRWRPDGNTRRHESWEVSVQGTLVMYAAAENKPRHLEALLERGHDVNSASPAAAAALLSAYSQSTVRYGTDFVPFHPFTARPESAIFLRRKGADPDEIPPLEMAGATPLAAAILFGHAECAWLLVEYGAWLLEAPSVSQAMWLALQEKNADYQAARACVLARSGKEQRPVLWALGRSCSPRQLKEVLETWTYPREELSLAARRMLVDFQFQYGSMRDDKQSWKDLCHRLRLIGRACPEALCAPEVIGELLDRCVQENEWMLMPFLPFLEGRTLDLSRLSGSFFWINSPRGKNLMELLASCCTCVMDRDAVPPGTRASTLRLLMKCVTFLPPAVDRGVSTLTVAILQTGSPQLIRQALQQGLIPPEETTEMLLSCQKQLRLPPICRTLLLTVPRPGTPRRLMPRQLVSRWDSSRWFQESVPTDVTTILEEADWERWLYPLLHDQTVFCRVEAAGETWQTDRFFIALCMRGETETAARWLTYMPDELWNTDSIFCADRTFHAVVTPLCAAALAGRTETVRMLLEHGAPAAEERYGNPGVWSARWPESDAQSRPITPLTASLLGGHWETARLLMDHGAACDLRDKEFLEVWGQFRDEDPKETVAPYLGTYLLETGVLRGQL